MMRVPTTLWKRLVEYPLGCSLAKVCNSLVVKASSHWGDKNKVPSDNSLKKETCPSFKSILLYFTQMLVLLHIIRKHNYQITS